MKVTHLTKGQNGAKVANQLNIEHNGVDYFQSYDTVIARYKPYYLEVTEDWNYSSTTSRYFGQWLRQWDIKDGELDNLRGLLRNATVGQEFYWILDNNNKIVVYLAEKGAFSL